MFVYVKISGSYCNNKRNTLWK